MVRTFSCSRESREIAQSSTFVSTKRTVMDLVTGEPIPRREGGDLRHDIALQSDAAIELRTALVEGAQELGNESTDRGTRLRRLDPGRPVDVVRDRDGEVLHGNPLTRGHEDTETQKSGMGLRPHQVL